MVMKDVPGGRARPGRRFSKMNQGMAQSTGRMLIRRMISQRRDEHHTPPENAISTLNALVLLSALASAFSALRMPTMIARITISPAELMAKEILETRLRAKDSKWEWSSGLS